ncbi:MAG: MSMEG_0568 family radical SAM protein [Pseudomonadota bacterium]
MSRALTDLLATDVQSRGVRLPRANQERLSRRGGAGPSDHQAMVIDGQTVMVPVYSHQVLESPYTLRESVAGDELLKDGIPLVEIELVNQPNFYRLKTADGVPYQQIATLHSTDVLATTVLQTCIRYQSRRKACKFCSIGQSLAAERTIERKTPQQLAEVTKAAVELDGVKHMVMTTGTPPTSDRGARILCESVAAVKEAVDIPIQVQCEPPKDLNWLTRLREAGADSLGMHIEVITPELRQRLMPGKAEITVDDYIAAFAYAVPVFGHAQVSTYLLAGLGDSESVMLATCGQLIALGVYPFVVPFVPIRGTPMEDHPAPTPEFMAPLLEQVGAMLQAAGMHSGQVKAGCAKCGACTSLNRFEGDTPPLAAKAGAPATSGLESNGGCLP